MSKLSRYACAAAGGTHTNGRPQGFGGGRSSDQSERQVSSARPLISAALAFLRNQVIPEPPEAEPRERLCKTPAKGKSRWHAWADLLWCVFEDLAGPGCGLASVCGGRLILHAVVRPPATLDVLDSLERSAKRKARGTPLPQLAYARKLADEITTEHGTSLNQPTRRTAT